MPRCFLHLPNNIYIPLWWSGGQGNRDTASADHMDERNSGSWCLSIFLTSILVWEVLIATLDALSGNWKAMVSSGNNRDKWKILAKGSIRGGYPMPSIYVSLELQLCWANLRGENGAFSVVLQLDMAIFSESKLSRYVYWIPTCTVHVYCIVMLQH